MAGSTQTISEYIVHHLTNLVYGKLPEGFVREDGSAIGEGGAWVMAHGGEEAAAMAQWETVKSRGPARRYACP